MPDFFVCLFVLKQRCARIVFLSHLLLLTFVNMFRQSVFFDLHWASELIFSQLCLLSLAVYMFMWKMFFILDVFLWFNLRNRKNSLQALIWFLQYWNPPWQRQNSLVSSFKQLCLELFCFVYKSLGFVTLALASPAALTPH